MSIYSDQVRKEFGQADEKRDAGLTTPAEIRRFDNILYGTDETWQKLDVYCPQKAVAEGKKLPVIVSVHGGGWVYGDKERYQYYCMDLARRGFTVVNFTYRLAPEFQFPAPFEDTNLVFAWVKEHGADYFMDTEHIFAVGDSAGANCLAVYAAICTNPVFAKHFTFQTPDITLRAIALNNGIASMKCEEKPEDLTSRLMADYMPGGGTKEELWLISPVYHVTADFPPTYLMTAPDDFLKMEAPEFAKKLTEENVPFVYRFYQDAKELLGHVFHLNLRSKMATICNDEECRFFQSYL